MFEFNRGRDIRTTEALQALRRCRRIIRAERMAPYQFASNNPRLAEAQRHAAAIRAWLRPPGIGARPGPSRMLRVHMPAAVAYLGRLRAPPHSMSEDQLRCRLLPGRPETNGICPPTLEAAAFLVRHAPGPSPFAQPSPSARASYVLRQTAAQAGLEAAIRYGAMLIEQNKKIN